MAGAGSILCDAALVFKDKLTPDIASFASHFGTLTQWLNDIKSIDEDYEERQYTPYVLEYYVYNRLLDDLQKQVFCYLCDVFSDEKHLKPFKDDPLKLAFLDTMRAFLMLKMFEGVAINKNKFSPAFYQAVEEKSPIPLEYLLFIRNKFQLKM